MFHKNVFPRVLLAGFSFGAGERTSSAVRKIPHPPNMYQIPIRHGEPPPAHPAPGGCLLAFWESRVLICCIFEGGRSDFVDITALVLDPILP